MTAEEVLKLYNELQNRGIHIWLDGGWAVDALLQEQTRPHQDVDIAVQHKDLEALEEFFTSLGFKRVARDENAMWDLVLRNGEGKEVEMHAFSFGGDGKVVEEKYWNGYSADSLTGTGTILGHEVRCVSLKQLVKTHDKNHRKLKTTDLHDMALLEKKFGVQFP